MNLELGLVCSRTDKIADFENECASYNLDKEEQNRLLRLELDAAGDGQSGDPIDYLKNKKQGRTMIVAGIIINILLYMIGAQIGISVIFYGIILYGTYQFIRGREQEKILKRHAEDSSKFE